MKNIFKNKKLLTFGVLGLFALALVSAGLTYYAFFNVTLDINQPISIDGDLEQSVDCDAGDVCLGDSIQLENTGDTDKSVFITDISPLGVIVSYVGEMTFAEKNLVTGVVSVDTEEITYSVTGEEFVATGIPTGYKLIYYPDMDGGFTENVQNILVYGEDTFPSLPVSEDIGDEYCTIKTGDDLQLANPNALVCNGAKLWLVENDYVSDLESGEWDISKILFETDLITYTVSSDGEVLIPAHSELTVYPQYDISEHIDGGAATVLITVA